MTNHRSKQLPATICLVTDFGDQLALAECRLALHKSFARNNAFVPTIIEVNDVRPYDRLNAAFHFHQLAKLAPAGTVFIGVIDPGVGSKRRSIIIETDRQHYFVGPDNGIFYPTAEHEGISNVWQISNPHTTEASNTFHGRDIFVPTAADLACGIDPDSLGEADGDEINRLDFEQGQILHVDEYGNYKIYVQIPLGASAITINGDGKKIPIVTTFEDVKIGQPLAYVGSSNLLELAIRERNAAHEFRYCIGECLDIRWHSGKQREQTSWSGRVAIQARTV